MRIFQQHQFDPCATAIDMDSDTFLSSSDCFALLNLVIPGDDAPLTSLEKEQTSVLNSSEFLTLLNLVIPGNDAPPVPLEMEQITSYGPSPGFTSHEWVSPPMPPQQGLVGFDFGDSSAQSLANYCSDASACIIPPAMMYNTEPFLNEASLIEPWTSVLRPEAAFDVPNSDGKQTFARPCELVTPLEFFQDSFKPLVQDVKRCPKASDKCIVPGCKTKKQSHGRREVCASVTAAERVAKR
ncbi:hypothetical protein PR002_g9681 [Phytophthora rubi]|uniref:Uncharacterized protein n=1 Tax=Phytophthora rubi TaxID=129364 RepID=A0A6A3MPR1_9STRA|nr:hypothetical protein PR002_g9681 [Phytophthora rubi]